MAIALWFSCQEGSDLPTHTWSLQNECDLWSLPGLSCSQTDHYQFFLIFFAHTRANQDLKRKKTQYLKNKSLTFSNSSTNIQKSKKHISTSKHIYEEEKIYRRWWLGCYLLTFNIANMYEEKLQVEIVARLWPTSFKPGMQAMAHTGTHTQTDIATYRLNRPKGRFSEKNL